jgi:hypothetical protein
LVGTYKYGGKVVSEREFKKKVYGSDSAQVKNYDKAQAKKSSSSKSKYISGKDRSGNPIYWDEKGNRQEGRSPDYEEPEKKAPIVIGVGKDEIGRTKVENVGKYLTEEQRREVSKLTSEKGRLTTKQISESRSINAQGQEEVSRSVQFAYTDKKKGSDVLVRPTDEEPPAYIQELAQKRFRENENAQKVIIGEWTFTRTGKTKEKEVPEYIGSGGMISKAEKPKGFYNKLEAKKDRLLSDVQKNDAKQEASFKEGGALFAIGAVQGVYNIGRIIVRPDQFVKGLWNIGKESVKDPLYLPRTLGQSFASNPSGFIGEVVASAGVAKLVSVGVKAGLAKYKAPKVVGEGYGQTLKTEVVQDVVEGGNFIEGKSSSSTLIKSGSNKFKVDTTSKSVDRLDFNDARIQSSKTDLNIQRVDKKGNVISENTGFSRSEVISSLTEDGVVLARGDSVQATNIGKGSVTTQGEFTAIGEGSSQGTRLTTIGSTGKGVKGKVVSSADDLKFVEDPSKKVSSIESSYSKKILEYDAPRSETFNTDAGKVTISQGADLKNALFDDFTTARGGSYLSETEKTSKIKVDPYGQTTSQGGVSVSYKNFGDGSPSSSFSPVKKPVVSDQAVSSVSSAKGSLKLSSSDQGPVLSVKNNVISKIPLSLPASSAQALKAVEDVVNQGTVKTNTIIEVSSKVVAPVSVGVVIAEAQNAPLRPLQRSKVKGATPVLISKTSTNAVAVPVQALKSFQSTDVLTKPKTALEGVLVTKGRTKSRLALATQQVQVADTIQQTQQKTKVVQLTAQKVATRTGLTSVQVAQTGLLISPVVSVRSPLQKTSGRGGFDVFVRKRGVFEKVNKTALGKSEARDLGAYNVANSPQATFTLRSSGSRLGFVSSKVRGSFFAFRSNFQKKGDLFIEKKEKRIKSGGEKAGITRLGVLANKNKGIFKGLKL